MSKFHDAEERAALVAEARSWIGTPYHVGGMVKGAGCCCGSLILAVLQARGLAPDERFGVYSSDSWAHWREDHYRMRLFRHARKLAEGIAARCMRALPGCIALARAMDSKVFNHAGIVTEWPRIVHAIAPAVIEVDATRDPLWIHREIEIFDPFGVDAEALDKRRPVQAVEPKHESVQSHT